MREWAEKKAIADRETTGSRMQTKQYEQQLRQWQEHAGKAYTPPGMDAESNAVTFVEGKGFHEKIPSHVAETAALSRIFAAFGYAMMAYLVVEYVLSFLLTQVLQLFHVNIMYFYDSGYVCGSVWAVLLLLLVDKGLKYLVPIWMLHRTFRMPRQVASPVRVLQPEALYFSAPLTVLVFSLMNLWRASVPHSITRYSTIGTAMQMLTYADVQYQVLYLVFDLFVVTALANFLFRGEILQVLRQFGDGFAVAVTSLVGTILFQDVASFPTMLIVYCICGYATLQSGSVLAGMLDLFLYRLLLYLLFRMECAGGVWTEWRMPYVLILLAGSLVWLGLLLLFRKIPRNPQSAKSSLTLGEKWSAALHTAALSIAVVLCLVLSGINALL